MKVLLVNESVFVLVDHVECFLELLDLRLVKHSEDVGGGTLGTLLCASLALGLAACHLQMLPKTEGVRGMKKNLEMVHDTTRQRSSHSNYSTKQYLLVLK